jgi:hypothetical protein
MNVVWGCDMICVNICCLFVLFVDCFMIYVNIVVCCCFLVMFVICVVVDLFVCLFFVLL